MLTNNAVNKSIRFFFSLFAVLYVSFAIIGAIRRYSDAPFGDMWDGYINWYLQDPWQSLWALHNEHRIVLARLMYWLDVVLFGNAGYFLILLNYLLVAGISLVFWLLLQEQVKKSEQNYPARILFLFLIAWLFAWTQRQNLIWGFQNQFFTAQLLPLCAFYFFYKSASYVKSRKNFIISCIIGVMSCGTMANGVLALPMMTVYACLTRQALSRIVCLLLLSLIFLSLYFYQFHIPENHSSLTQSLLHSPLLVMEYSLLYLGGPFVDIFRYIDLGNVIILTMFAGYFLVINSFYFMSVVKYRSKQCGDLLPLTLVFFIFYIFATAIGTAGGRIIFGLETAFTSRYSTPAIMAWAALFLLYYPWMATTYKKHGNKIWLPFMLIIVLMFPVELTALKNTNYLNSKKQIAMLALELKVHDRENIQLLGIKKDSLPVIEEAYKKHFVISGMKRMIGMRAQLGKVIANHPSNSCRGQIEKIESLSNDKQFLRIKGWMTFENNKMMIPNLIRFLDAKNRIIGYALSGELRDDLPETISKKAAYEGYILSSAKEPTTVLGENPDCRWLVTATISS